MGINWIGMLAAGSILGGGLLWWLTRKLKQAEVDKIDALSQRNWNQGQQDAKAAEDAAALAVEEAKKNAKISNPLDW